MLLSLFAICRDIYSKLAPIADAEIDQFSNCLVACRYIHGIVYHSPYIEYVVTRFFGNITGSSVDEFLRFYRATFHDATFTLKLHLLEDHVVPQMRRCMALVLGPAW